MNQPKIHYLDNEKFIELLEKHFEDKKLHPEIGCPNEIGAMFLLIARKYIANWPSKITFEHSEDMQMYGVEYCLRYMYNYSREKSDNPFSYFTEIIKSAFQQKYNYEKKKKDIIKNVAGRMAEEECFVTIRNNKKSYRNFNNPIDSQIEQEVIERNEQPEEKTIILWEDELVVQNMNTDLLDELFYENTKKEQ
jgi:hypothetical protein